MGLEKILPILAGAVVFVIDWSMLRGTAFFIPLIAIAITITWLPYWVGYLLRKARARELEAKFSEFVGHLVGAVRSGMPVSKAIVYVSEIDYGALTPHVKKLANKMEWAIPVHKALMSFAEETKNPVIKRAIATVIEAEESGGNIEDVLIEVTSSMIEIKKLKERRRAAIHSQIVTCYIIFFVFLAIVIAIQNFLIPYLVRVQAEAMVAPGVTPPAAAVAFTAMLQRVRIDITSPVALVTSLSAWLTSLYGLFFMMVVIQSVFAGLVIGKLSEGEVSAGLKHSLILATIAIVVISFAQGLVS